MCMYRLVKASHEISVEMKAVRQNINKLVKKENNEINAVGV